MNLAVVGMSHKTAPVELRERLAGRSEAAVDPLRILRETEGVEEAVFLSTCNRVEAYVAVATGELLPAVEAALARAAGLAEAEGAEFSRSLYRLTGPAAARHLFRVAAGLDSLVVGETEVLGQVKEAYLLAAQAQTVGRVLNPLFQAAFAAAKEVHTRTRISRRPASVGSVAVAFAARIFGGGGLAERSALVIGAGRMAERTAESLVERGVRRLTVSNRSVEAGRTLAERLAADWLPFERLEEGLAGADIVIASTAAPRTILDRPMLARAIARRRHRPMLVIDIAVPRDVEASAADLADLFLYDIDDLEAVVSESLRAREAELAESERIVAGRAERHAARFLPTGGTDAPRHGGHRETERTEKA